MTWRLPLSLMILAGCGRLSFDAVATTHEGNCPGSAELEHDEDGDGLGDTCDPCPHLAGDDADLDGDGVGDACDPAPEQPGNSIMEFLSFASPPTGWLETSAVPWSYTDDAARVALVGEQVAMLTIPSPGDAVVQTRVVVAAVSPDAPPQNTARNFAVIDNYNVMTDSGLLVGAVQDWSNPPATATILRVINSTGSGDFATSATAPMLTVDAPYDLTYRRSADHIDAVLDGPEPNAPFALAADVPDTGGRLGIRSRGLTVAFEYVIVIR